MSDIIKFVPIDDKIFRSTGSKSMLFRPSSKVRIESGYKKGIEEQVYETIYRGTKCIIL